MPKMKILSILQFHEWNYLTMQRQFDLQSKCLFWFNFFFLVRGRSRSGQLVCQSLKIDLFTKKKKNPKKKKGKRRKIKERETNKKHSSTWHVMSCVSCSCECIECLRKPSFICVNLKFKYITINYSIYIQRGSVTMNNRKLKTQRFIL